MTNLKIFLTLLTSMMPLASAHALEYLRCRGTLPAFTGNGMKFTERNKDLQGFELSAEEAGYVRVGLEADKPFVEVLPWGHISHEEFKANYNKDFHFEYESDDRTWFAVGLIGRKSKLQFELRCNIVTADQVSKPVEAKK